MNKEEFYEKAVNIRKKTGQGLSGTIFKSVDHKNSPSFTEMTKQLVDEGKFKIIHQQYNSLPDDEWWCVDDSGYCVEEDYEDNMNYLEFVRYYLGGGDEKIFGSMTINEFVSKKQDDYDNWLEENKEKLEIIK
jgi:hypothetical protein